MLEAYIETPQRHRELSLFPVLSANGPDLAFLSAAAALDSGTLEVRLKGDDAHPSVLARNHSLHGILIVEGEPLCQQEPGLIAQRSILLPGKSVTEIPTEPCPDEGEATGSPQSDPTEWARAFPLLGRQVGCLAILGRQVLGLEAFGSARLYAPHHERLISRFVLEAIAQEEREGESRIDWSDSIQREEAASLVEALERAERTAVDSTGMGHYWALSGSVQGGELIHERYLVHVSARPATESSGAEPTETETSRRGG
jgi:hypothetical protein